MTPTEKSIKRAIAKCKAAGIEYKKGAWTTKYDVVCNVCGCEFCAKSPVAKYCSSKCRNKQNNSSLRRAETLNRKYQKDEMFCLKLRIKSRLAKSFRKIGREKVGRTLDFVGCDIDFLKIHIEKQFAKGMTWENRGRYGWHLDHIRPCSSFNLSNPEQQKLCFHYTNYQPLWAHENLTKSNKLI